MKRYAIVTSADSRRQAEAYLPPNYAIIWEGPVPAYEGAERQVDGFVIAGEDVAGWTLDGYVIPRYGSGMIGCREVAPLVAAVSRAKREILEDVANGVVPATVASFSDLHDHVDANEYGGLCDPDEYGEKDTAFANAVQDVVHAWIVAGGVRDGAEVDDPDEWIDCECGAGPFTDSDAVAAHALQWHPNSAS